MMVFVRLFRLYFVFKFITLDLGITFHDQIISVRQKAHAVSQKTSTALFFLAHLAKGHVDFSVT
jgi:hypothetical protein